MNNLEKKSVSNNIPDAEVVESEDELTSVQQEQLHTVKYKIQLILFRYLQQELFSDSPESKKEFENWIVNHYNLLKKISETGKEIILRSTSPGEEKKFVETEVADEILEKILEDEELKQELEKIKSDVGFDNFDYYEMEELMSTERPDWGKKWKKAS